MIYDEKHRLGLFRAPWEWLIEKVLKAYAVTAGLVGRPV